MIKRLSSSCQSNNSIDKGEASSSNRGVDISAKAVERVSALRQMQALLGRFRVA